MPRVNMSGKPLRFENLNPEAQEFVKKRLEEKNPLLKKVRKEKTTGVKINGELVTADNIHKFEVSKKPSKAEYTEKQLFALNKDEQVALLKKLGEKTAPRLERTRVAKILELQR